MQHVNMTASAAVDAAATALGKQGFHNPDDKASAVAALAGQILIAEQTSIGFERIAEAIKEFGSATAEELGRLATNTARRC